MSNIKSDFCPICDSIKTCHLTHYETERIPLKDGSCGYYVDHVSTMTKECNAEEAQMNQSEIDIIDKVWCSGCGILFHTDSIL